MPLYDSEGGHGVVPPSTRFESGAVDRTESLHRLGGGENRGLLGGGDDRDDECFDGDGGGDDDTAAGPAMSVTKPPLRGAMPIAVPVAERLSSVSSPLTEFIFLVRELYSRHIYFTNQYI